jgi:hypothetical protein
VLKLKGQYYSKNSIIRAVTKEAGSKANAKRIVETVLLERKDYLIRNPDVVKAGGSSDIKTGLIMILLGGAFSFIFAGGLALVIGGVLYTLHGMYKKLK